MPAQLKPFLAVLGPITFAALTVCALAALSPASLSGFSGFLWAFSVILVGIGGSLWGWMLAISDPIDALMRTRQSLEVVARRSETAELPDREMALHEVATLLRETGEAVATRMAQEGQVNTALMRREGELYAMLNELREKHEAMLRGEVTEGEIGDRLVQLTDELENARHRAELADKRQAQLLDHLGKDLRAPAQRAISLLDEIEPLAGKAGKSDAFVEARESLRVLLGIANDGADQLKRGTMMTPPEHPAAVTAEQVEEEGAQESALISTEDTRALRQAKALQRKRKRAKRLERRQKKLAEREARLAERAEAKAAKKAEKKAARKAAQKATKKAHRQAEQAGDTQHDKSAATTFTVAQMLASIPRVPTDAAADEIKANLRDVGAETPGKQMAKADSQQGDDSLSTPRPARPMRKVKQGKNAAKGARTQHVPLGSVSLTPIVLDEPEIAEVTSSDAVSDQQPTDNAVEEPPETVKPSESFEPTAPAEPETMPEQKPAKIMGAASAAPSMPLTGGLRILAADDNAVGRLLIETLLRREGHIVEMVDNGAAAIEAATSQPFDLMLLDHAMPDMSGADVLAALQEQGGACANTPALLVQRVDRSDADALATTLRAANDAGFAGLLPRPVKSETLLPMIERLRRAINGEGEQTAKATVDAAE